MFFFQSFRFFYTLYLPDDCVVICFLSLVLINAHFVVARLETRSQDSTNKTKISDELI